MEMCVKLIVMRKESVERGRSAYYVFHGGVGERTFHAETGKLQLKQWSWLGGLASLLNGKQDECHSEPAKSSVIDDVVVLYVQEVTPYQVSSTDDWFKRGL
jgi:hypothetical protein